MRADNRSSYAPCACAGAFRFPQSSFGSARSDITRKEAEEELTGQRLQADKNPATESTFLTGSKDVEKVGPQTVDGVETTHYTGSLPLSTMRASLKDEDKATRKRREKSLEQYEKMGISTLTMDMWIDGDDRTKQFRMRGEANKGPLDLTITFLDYNKPVAVDGPAREGHHRPGRDDEGRRAGSRHGRFA